MGVYYQADGSVICTGNADPTRTATYPAPRNGATQNASIVAFFVGDPPFVDPFSGPSLLASIQALQAAMAAIPTQFVNSGTYMTIDQLVTGYPAGSAYDGMYANVSNLFNGTSAMAAGGVREVVRCRRDITNGTYAWTLQREGYNSAVAMTGGSLVIAPLINPPTIRLTGTLLGNISISASSTNAYVGLRQRIIQNSSLGLFTTTITGLIGSNITLLGNTVQDLEYTVSGWTKAST